MGSIAVYPCQQGFQDRKKCPVTSFLGAIVHSSRAVGVSSALCISFVEELFPFVVSANNSYDKRDHDDNDNNDKR